MSELGAKSAATEIMIAWVGSLVVTKTNGKLVPPPALNPQVPSTHFQTAPSSAILTCAP